LRIDNSIRNFTWHIFCDQYIESIKYRLYSKEDEDGRKAAQYALYHTTLIIIELLASICPHLTESIYHMIVKDAEAESIHKTQWPSEKQELIDEVAEREGDLIQAVISEVRKIKSEKRISLKKPLQEVIIYGKGEFGRIIKKNSEVVQSTCHIEQLNIYSDQEFDKGRALQNYPEIRVLVKH